MTVTEKTLPTINMHWRIITFRCLPKKYIVGNETNVEIRDAKHATINKVVKVSDLLIRPI
jgi:hypothetical protein